MDFKFNGMVMIWLWDTAAYVWKKKWEKKIISKLNDIDVNGLMSCVKICRRIVMGFGAWHFHFTIFLNDLQDDKIINL